MKTPVLDHGFVELLNVSGPVRRTHNVLDEIEIDIGGGQFRPAILVEDLYEYDADDIDPAKTARISFDNLEENRSYLQDINLVEYLMKNYHCYHPDMQVLTELGWKFWKDLGEIETFLIPNPKTHLLHKETLSVQQYLVNDVDMCGFRSTKMEYLVTPEHDIWVKGKYETRFTKQKASLATNWGNHESGAAYKFCEDSLVSDNQLQFVGFFLGDGSFRSTDTLNFHLKKPRKIKYLTELAKELGIALTIQEEWNRKGVFNLVCAVPKFLKNYIDTSFIDKRKAFKLSLLADLSQREIRGLWEGLVNSDGHWNLDKNRVEFSSTSENLIEIFEFTSTLLGFESHKLQIQNGVHKINATFEPENLGRRAEYLYTEKYSGKVYCTTSSTGLLVVRGSPTSHSFICGNSTPIEMIETWWHMKMPIFIARQFVRHRTATINEVSGRYTTLPAEWYIPEIVGGKSKSNKQGQENNLDNETQERFRTALNESCSEAYQDYLQFLNLGVAPEHARMLLHLNHYTHWIWKQDLHNLMHFLSLRLDKHAQVEARAFAEAMYENIKQVLPDLMELFNKYRRFKD